ncbi:MAG: ABC transporter permease [Marinovum algicola]|jgi:peptide/nickel transport system permease protein|uniref:Peptide/nickel transport system permease protein n=1 Tax=Marinovum algicola TaxID=42444 RepID=A0A975ZLG0_9RHOB|nr:MULTISPECIES: ABC transporter permease [Marinovum]MDD9742701.1 ABC transporter permease [Marinovum sp. PR37]SEI58957.1 peptide/nickel transport system permease protein [Marinovum algicola]SLN27330.1 Oligopeptide transport system permease protein OppC [Marinovum algicola]
MTAIDTAAEVQAAESVKSPALLGPWALMWRQFRRHKVAWVSLYIVGFIYFVALFGEFLAPSNYLDTNTRAPFAPPQGIHFFTEGEDGGRDFQLHARGLKMEIDREAMRRHFVEDPSKVIPLGFFVEGYEYKLLWLIPTNRHFFGPTDPGQRVYFFGADRLGRDILSRIIMGTRISMSIGLVGVAVSLVVGVSLGGISGYYGGWIDNAIQRLIEFLRSIPTIPLWMGLAAAIPLDWPPLRTYFVVTLIVSMIGWTTLAREVRGKFLSLRHEDFVIAARLDGLSDWEVIRKHLVPSFASHIIASLTLAVPLMILAETSLSFLGIGLQPPIVSWGTLLKEAQNIRTIIEAPWLLIAPGSVIVITVLALNFLGDGLRDAADPYAH